ncbi:transglycosylase domain-containing protein [Clostridium gasigenes]|uniref:transglycosylase domain-containing protein n=1 Tax=Clostridium gasigenes TaxID=94869 RepID=UPI001627600A|nr:transglycosylase domain-containing protein [Clostridium gasigenes]MBB6622006.1 transglycosylase domain-containing protein [Clostridium gasigenes]
MADKKNFNQEKSQANVKNIKTDLKNNTNISSSKKNKKQSKFMKFLKKMFLIIFIVGILTVTVALGYVFAIIKTSPELDVNAIANLSEQSILLDSSGNLIDNLPTEEIRTKIDIAAMPNNLKNAYISIEDERFYKHKGIDIKRILGAVYRDVINIVNGNKNLHGASTLTQQVIKNTVLTNEVSINRKVKEIYLALKLEKKLSKDQILSQYLNTIPLGGKVYGVEEAAKYYFDKSAKDLSLIESAYIAGITQAPSFYSAYNENNIADPVEYLDRTKTVLMKMRDLKFITLEEYNVAYAEVNENKFVFSQTVVDYRLKYEWFVLPAVEQVKKDLKEKYKYTDDEVSKLMLNGGLKIHTTMDKKLQDSTQNILNERSNIKNNDNGGVDAFDENGVPLLQASAVVMDYRTGYVKALIGGRGEQPAHSLNRASDALRPIASNTKPLTVYGPAIDTKIMTAATPIDDSPLPASIANQYQPGWNLNNHDFKLEGFVSPRDAITWSKNIASVITEHTIGLKTGLAYGEKLGIKYNAASASSIAALALGEHNNAPDDLDGGNPLILASAFGTFGNKGNRSEPVFYTKVEDSTGKVLLDGSSEQIPVFSPQTAYIMYDILKGPVAKFDGGPAKFSDMPVSGKTGTSDSVTDWWFSGLTPYYSGSVWVGYDNKYKMNGYSSAAANLWGKIMAPAHEGLEVTEIEKPDGIVTASVCKDSGKKPTNLCSHDQRGSSRVVTEMFIAGTEPTTVCDVHVTAKVNKNNNKLASDNTPKWLIEDRVFIRKPNASSAASDYKYTLPTQRDDSKSEAPKPEAPKPDVPKPDQSNGNSAPELNGIADRSIKVGETFDPIAGVTATDKEDGDLTSKIVISGTVDTTAPGSYKVNYSVTDSKNKTVTKQKIITVTGS